METAQVKNKLSADQFKNVVTMVISGDYVKWVCSANTLIYLLSVFV